MEFLTPFKIAFSLLFSADPELMDIIRLSMTISLSAVACSLLAGLPIGAILASMKFPGRQAIIILSNTLLSMPPVVVGLIIYILVSQSGPLGWTGILYTPYAMALAQTVLVLPISIALSRQVFETLNTEYNSLFLSLGIGRWQRIKTLVFDARIALVTIALACFGRAISEVGAVIIVGGNIRHVSRVMTTTIALETSKGELGIAMALGIVLLTIALLVNVASQSISAHFKKAGLDV
jgi:tungstate transport system permease protein|tara:strand:+ start:168 stop:875 length:708 start_codon:yes stop_codon:yes gene_type:complete